MKLKLNKVLLYKYVVNQKNRTIFVIKKTMINPGQKIKNLRKNTFHEVESVMMLDSYESSVIFTKDGLCLPMVDISEEESIQEKNEHVDFSLEEISYRFLGCSSYELKTRQGIIDKKISENLLTIKIKKFINYEITFITDNVTKYGESHHIHTNLRCQFVFRTKNKTYSFLVKKSK